MKRSVLILNLFIFLLGYGALAQTNPSITASKATGIITTCAINASTNLQQTTVSGTNLTANISLAAPGDFEISISPTSGFATYLTLTESNGTVNTTVIYVRASSSATVGTISGNISITSPGATSQAVAVTGTVYVLPSVNQVPNQTVGSGTSTAAINFSGTGNTFNWVNDTPGIGLLCIKHRDRYEIF